MSKLLKIGLVIIVLTVFIVVFSPFLSLVCPEKLRNHTYYRLMYSVIAEKETAGVLTQEEKTLRLFSYIVNHEFLQGVPYSCKPFDSLIYGEAYCDFQARTLNVLAEAIDIPCRYAMLVDKDGVSPHTLNEVFLQNKWCVFDPAINVIYSGQDGGMISLDEMSREPELIFKNKKISAWKDYNQKHYVEIVKWYNRMFPVMAQPRRSGLYKPHILDYVLDAYFNIFKNSFLNVYQDLYLRIKYFSSNQDELRLFFIARNYHLAYRNNLALKYYKALFKKYPSGKYMQDGLLFCGILYFDMNDLVKAEEFLRRITDSKWKSAANFYLGRIYELTGRKEDSLMAYSNVSIYQLPGNIVEQLNQRNFNAR